MDTYELKTLAPATLRVYSAGANIRLEKSQNGF